MLEPNPKQRITIFEIMQHPWFDVDVTDSQVKEIRQKFQKIHLSIHGQKGKQRDRQSLASVTTQTSRDVDAFLAKFNVIPVKEKKAA